MRTTDDRYRAEQARHELALRLIRHEARTGTIRQLTGLSDDRIRRLYGSYFKHRPDNDVRRRRGRTPSQVALFFKTPGHRRQAASLAAAFVAGGLFDPRRRPGALETGHLLCRAYERYLEMPGEPGEPRLTFEWAWNLLASLRGGDELALAICDRCGGRHVRDLLSLDEEQCPSCLLLPEETVPAATTESLFDTAKPPA